MTEFRRNKVAMGFQNYGLLSHRSVMYNVAYGLEIRGMDNLDDVNAAQIIGYGLEAHVHVMEMLRTWDFNITVYKGVAAWMSENEGSNSHDAALWWLGSNPEAGFPRTPPP